MNEKVERKFFTWDMPSPPHHDDLGLNEINVYNFKYTELIKHTLRRIDGWEIRHLVAGGVRWISACPQDVTISSAGWKLHVSTSAKGAHALVSVFDLLIKNRMPFKFPETFRSIEEINSGRAGLSQIGKVVTIYPPSGIDISKLVSLLDGTPELMPGPIVLTDRYEKAGSCISMRFGVMRSNEVHVDSIGHHFQSATLQDGDCFIDRRSIEASLHDLDTNVSSNGTKDLFKGLSEMPAAWGDERPQILSLLAKGVLRRTWLCMRPSNAETCVVKSAISRTIMSWDGIDNSARLKNEAKILACLAESGLMCPRLISFSPGPVSHLVVSDISGTPINHLSPLQATLALPAYASALAQFHSLGYVHRDVKLSNAILCDNGVAIIDFELSHRETERFGTSLGTPLYVAPEVLRGHPCRASDTYAFGIALAHTLLQTDPALVADDTKVIGELLASRNVCFDLRALFQRLILSNPNDRPPMKEVAGVVYSVVSRSTIELPCETVDEPLDSCITASEGYSLPDVTNALMSFAETSPNGSIAWRNSHLFPSFRCEGINIGASGVLLGMMSLDANGYRDYTKEILSTAQWLSERSPIGTNCGLFTGDAGVAIALAVCGRRYSLSNLVEASRRRIEKAITVARTCHCDMFSGSAGVLYALSIMSAIDSGATYLPEGDLLANEIIRRMNRADNTWPTEPTLGQTESHALGAAHGAAGITLALVAYSEMAGDAELSRIAVQAMEDTVRTAHKNLGKLRLRLSIAQPLPLPWHWCNGIGGILWASLLHDATSKPLGMTIAGILDELDELPIVDNPTMCHGLSGLLELYRLSAGHPVTAARSEARLERVGRDLEAIMVTRDSGKLWFSEAPHVVSPDLWVGFLGPIVQLQMLRSGVKDSILSKSWLKALADGAAK